MRALRLAATHYLRTQNSQQAIRFNIIAILGSQEQVSEIVHLEDGFY